MPWPASIPVWWQHPVAAPMLPAPSLLARLAHPHQRMQGPSNLGTPFRTPESPPISCSFPEETFFATCLLQARLKYLINEWGMDKFRSVVEQYFGKQMEVRRLRGLHVGGTWTESLPRFCGGAVLWQADGR